MPTAENRIEKTVGVTLKFSFNVLTKFLMLFALAAMLTPSATIARSETVSADLSTQIVPTMERAATYFYSKLADNGTYVWSYSEDLKRRRGEGSVEFGIGWNQPPGSPAVGAAYLSVYQVTGEKKWLEAARETARALVATQLVSGGWYYHSDMRPEAVKSWCYRQSTELECDNIEGNKSKDRTVLDDNTTQAVLNFLMWFDDASDGVDRSVQNAIEYGLSGILKHQYSNGAFAVFFNSKKEKDEFDPHLTATIAPGQWSKTWVKPVDPPYFSTNDNLVRDTIHTLIIANRRFGKDEYLAAARRAGDFLINAQLPVPQRGWAQLYDQQMHPVWGRAFEPPSLASSETASGVEAMLNLYEKTKDKRYLDSANQAIEWLDKVRLPDGRWARFYELGTDRPLYVDSENSVSYSDTDLLSHYNLKDNYGIPALIDRIRAVNANEFSLTSDQVYWPSDSDRWPDDALEGEVRVYLEKFDAEGRWLNDGWIKSQNFVDSMFAMSQYIQRIRGKAEKNQ